MIRRIVLLFWVVAFAIPVSAQVVDQGVGADTPWSVKSGQVTAVTATYTLAGPAPSDPVLQVGSFTTALVTIASPFFCSAGTFSFQGSNDNVLWVSLFGNVHNMNGSIGLLDSQFYDCTANSSDDVEAYQVDIAGWQFFRVHGGQSATITNNSVVVSVRATALAAPHTGRVTIDNSLPGQAIPIQGFDNNLSLAGPVPIDLANFTIPISVANNAPLAPLYVSCTDQTCAATTTDNSVVPGDNNDFMPSGGLFNDSLSDLVATHSGFVRITKQRAFHVNFRDALGNEVATATAAPAGTERALLVRNIPSGSQTVTGTVTTTPPSNASTNVAQLAGTTTSVNSGTKDAGTLRVVIATDQPALTNKLLVTPDSVALPANQSVNVSQINAVTPLMNTGATGAGSQRVTVAIDAATVAGSASLPAGTNVIGHIISDADTPGTGATNLGKAEDAAHTSADVGVMALGVRKDTNATTTSADGDYAFVAVDAYSAAFARVDHPNRIRCTVTVSTATVITAVGGSCAAPGAGLSLYITDISFASNAQAIAADAFPTLKYGTGGTCGTGTTVFWGAFMPAATQQTITQNFHTPIKIPANNEVCWINSTAGSKFIVISGFIAQ